MFSRSNVVIASHPPCRETTSNRRVTSVLLLGRIARWMSHSRNAFQPAIGERMMMLDRKPYLGAAAAAVLELLDLAGTGIPGRP
jgi:hypothetical protein